MPGSRYRTIVAACAALCTAALLALPAHAGWSTGPNLARERAAHGAVVLPSGKVLVAGGAYAWKAFFTAECELYDPVGNAWASTGAMSTPRSEFGLVLLNNGKVLAIGGYYKDSGYNDLYLATCELYDPVAGTWSATGSMAVPRSAFATVLLSNGKVLVCGGLNKNPQGTDVYLNGAEIYDPTAGTWSTAANLSQSRSTHTATLLQNGKVLVVGGASGYTALTSAEEYDPTGNAWASAGNTTSPHAGHTATRLQSGKVLVASGAAGLSTTMACELYDPVARSWSATGNIGTDRALHTATLLTNGQVLAAGGMQGFPDLKNPILTCELYDPASGLWTAADPMAKTREVHTANLLQNGTVLVVGGLLWDGTNFYCRKACEIYTPASQGCSVTCTASPSTNTGAAPLAVDFTSTATPTNCSGTPAFAWTFGDGATSTQQNPSHTYASAGSFSWSTVATVDGVNCTKGGTITVSGATCSVTCTATATPSYGGAPLAVAFAATATATGCGQAVTYDWDFGDGSAHSSQQNPSHTYAAQGTYGWTLTACSGSTCCVKTGTLAVGPPCTLACTASASPTSGYAPLTVSFQSTVTPSNCGGTPTFSWNLGDAVTTPEQNPTHTYVVPGIYNWTLTVTADGVTCQRNGTVTATAGCTYALTPSSKSFAPAAGSVNVTVNASGQSSCGTPTISVSDPWVTATLTTYANNKGKVKVAVAQNTSATPRTARVTIGGSAFTVSQAGATCKVTAVSPTRQTVAAAGGTNTIAVTATAGACPWTATPNGAAAAWITVTAGTGTGPGTATYVVSPNTTGRKRTGTISVAAGSGKKNVTVTQNP